MRSVKRPGYLIAAAVIAATLCALALAAWTVRVAG